MSNYKENPELALPAIQETLERIIDTNISLDDIRQHLPIMEESKHPKLLSALKNRICESLKENLEQFWTSSSVLENLKIMKELEENSGSTDRRLKMEALTIDSIRGTLLAMQKEILREQIAKVEEENQNLKNELLNLDETIKQHTELATNFDFKK